MNKGWYGVIHKPCGQERGEGGSRKNHVCPYGGREGLGAYPRGQKLFVATHLFAHEFKKGYQNFKKKLYM